MLRQLVPYPKFWRYASWAVISLMCSATPLLAQSDEAIPEKKVRYVISYVLVILCVGLGLYVVCRPGKRGRDIGS
ncbi:MAG: hypothetical protein KDA60_01505 [Planctomycetales bacterium]|nr:hypothetical protein [Planctomycetales bacterium]